MVPHAEPLEDEQLGVFPVGMNRNRLILCQLPWVLEARTDHTEVGRGDPLIVSLEEEPHDAANNVGIDKEEEGVEGDLGESLRLDC